MITTNCTDNKELQDEQEDMVSPEHACPKCGERRMDYLGWINDESEEVKCVTCGTVYEPV